MRHKLLPLVLIATGVLMLASFGIVSSGNLNVTVNGVPVEGIQALGIATGGVFISLIAAVFALAVVAVVAAGASMVLTAICVMALFALILFTAPIFLPGVVVAVAIAWLVRRKDKTN